MKKITRKLAGLSVRLTAFIIHMSVLFAAMGAGYAFAESSDGRPNIVLILADDLGYNDPGCYRGLHPSDPRLNPKNLPTSSTPNIDYLAGRGMLWTDFYAGAAVCSPSRAALLTGRNATRTGVYNWLPPDCPMHLRESEITIGNMLQEAGFNTAHFGKWHLTSQGGGDQPLPNDQGYDYSFFSFNNASPSYRNPDNYFRNGKAVGVLQGYACDLVVDEAMLWLDGLDHAQPFYINIWFNEPHRSGINFNPPYSAPRELVERHPGNGVYYGAIENMDQSIGRLIEYLKENGHFDNTFIIFSSDNGSQWDHSNDPLRGSKAFNFEGGIRVPFIAVWPSKIGEGSTSDLPGSFVDVLPTISAAVGLQPPRDRVIDGVDLTAVLTGRETEVEREVPIFFFRYFHDPILMLREGDWCLLGYDKPIPLDDPMNRQALGKTRPWAFTKDHMEVALEIEAKHFELYNLRDDIGQRRDLADSHPEIVRRLKSQMLRLQKEMLEEGGNWYK